MQRTHSLRILETQRLVAPEELKAALPASERGVETVVWGRETVRRILARQDPRLLVVVGPCSIHDPASALEYARRLLRLAPRVEDQLFLVMRVYFEKPRTTIGWKGLVNDPHLDGSYDIEEGLRLARRILLDIGELGLPTASEFLDPVVPRYLCDLASWAAIGARTTESQTHREMASGLSMPVGFKNGTDGSLQTAVDAMRSAQHPHHFLGIDEKGFTSIVRTLGNPDGHVILRGGRERPNYDPQSLETAAAHLRAAGLPPVLMVDCSHANSAKQHARQEEVWFSLIEQRLAGNEPLIGAMLESHLEEGNQPFPQAREKLRYGVSITDACLGWEATERILEEGALRLRTAVRDREPALAG
jgi:3-deoxy-7-phosphoheptulonate synthase